MILGIGTDIEEIKRFKKVSKNFLSLVFSKKEIEYCNSKKEPSLSFAGKFCAKEAIIKAYKTNISMKDIEVLLDKNKKIIVYIRGKPHKNIFCSIAHTQKNAIAFATIGG